MFELNFHPKYKQNFNFKVLVWILIICSLMDLILNFELQINKDRFKQTEIYFHHLNKEQKLINKVDNIDDDENAIFFDLIQAERKKYWCLLYTVAFILNTNIKLINFEIGEQINLKIAADNIYWLTNINLALKKIFKISSFVLNQIKTSDMYDSRYVLELKFLNNNVVT